MRALGLFAIHLLIFSFNDAHAVAEPALSRRNFLAGLSACSSMAGASPAFLLSNSIGQVTVQSLVDEQFAKILSDGFFRHHFSGVLGLNPYEEGPMPAALASRLREVALNFVSVNCQVAAEFKISLEQVQEEAAFIMKPGSDIRHLYPPDIPVKYAKERKFAPLGIDFQERYLDVLRDSELDLSAWWRTQLDFNRKWQNLYRYFDGVDRRFLRVNAAGEPRIHDEGLRQESGEPAGENQPRLESPLERDAARLRLLRAVHFRANCLRLLR